EAARSWAAEAAGTAARARTAEAPAGTRAAEAAARSRAAFLPRTRLAHRERTAHERLLIEALNGFFGLLAFEVLDERKPARPSRFAIDRDDHLRWVAHRREMRPKIRFGRAVWHVTDEQTHCH